ncbi:MAG: GtrA family protein [Oscillospiraceae bacterium]|nr:GtrA family protein [Oscillospiraceae bacterium]
MEKKKEFFRALKFVLFSASAGIIEFGSFTLLDTLTPLPYWACHLISLTASVVWNFTLNRKFTFQSTNNVPKAMLLVGLFYCIFTPLTAYVGEHLVTNLHWNEYLVKIITMLFNLTTEYLYDRFVVFRGSIDTNERAQKKAQ